MRFVVDADLPRGTKDLLATYAHEAVDVRDIGMSSARDSEVATLAQQRKACILTGDFGFADLRHYPPNEFYGIVVFELPRDATARYILGLIEAFLRQEEILPMLERRLAIVEAGRVRLRPK